MAQKKYVYFYGVSKELTEGDSSMKAILGGKGANRYPRGSRFQRKLAPIIPRPAVNMPPKWKPSSRRS